MDNKKFSRVQWWMVKENYNEAIMVSDLERLGDAQEFPPYKLVVEATRSSYLNLAVNRV